MSIIIKAYDKKYISQITEIWNEIVTDGVAFPQTDCLDVQSGDNFFSAQSYTGIAVDTENNTAVGLYILHPNNIGRCSHISNASYAVKASERGKHIGELLVSDCIKAAKRLGFKILQFNAVVKTNTPALSLYKKLGFVRLGTIPGGFLTKEGKYEDIIPHYITL